MNSKMIFSNVLRFALILLVQVFILKRIVLMLDGRPSFQILFYPVFLMILPFKTPRIALMLIGFLMGIFIDMFYTPLGLHAGALVLMGYARPWILSFLAPRDGYNMNHSPTIKRMGRTWFLKYAASLLFLHTFFYFSLEAFTFVYIVDILWQTLTSFAISMVFILIFMQVFNPED
ncbi:MAG: hypothetical protein HUU01_16115 [Saprospiraceae bacterium]|nr:hypothetical protein [Saprospiraceae bacterium]